eukprot:TRINITY_DN3333_c0_g1_i1.p5 TRINITY_DN3333_c0_g1~~TRINITY_DN3333_c0_g1_i1.p5  ORF type:complete len:104 (-),score=4.66 TRINITY_DN3333_c0_g1_i1:26-337(-)
MGRECFEQERRKFELVEEDLYFGTCRSRVVWFLDSSVDFLWNITVFAVNVNLGILWCRSQLCVDQGRVFLDQILFQFKEVGVKVKVFLQRSQEYNNQYKESII